VTPHVERHKALAACRRSGDHTGDLHARGATQFAGGELKAGGRAGRQPAKQRGRHFPACLPACTWPQCCCPGVLTSLMSAEPSRRAPGDCGK
jgi:hypothetical protein